MIKKPLHEKISTPLKVLGTVTNVDDGKTFLEIQYPTVTGNIRTKLYERSVLRRPQKLIDLLLDDGISEAIDKQRLISILNDEPPAHRDVTSKTGWHGYAFVYPGMTFGVVENDLKFHQEPSPTGCLGTQHGSVENWADGLRKAIKFSDYLLFAASLGPAGALLDMIDETEGVVFHLHGSGNKTTSLAANSSSGKTTCARVAMSAIEPCDKTDLPGFQLTDRGLEEHCFSRNHLVVAFDEEGATSVGNTGPVIQRSKFAYKITAGRGARRSRKARSDRDLQNLTWSLIAITTGETPLDSDRPVTRAEGDQVRMIAIPVPQGSQGGIFNRTNKIRENLGNSEKIPDFCARLIREVDETIRSYYGTAMPAFLAQLVTNRAELKPEIISIIQDFVTDETTDGTDPWQSRFVKKFGIVLAAAILMARYRIGPWTEKRARLAIRRLCRKALDTARPSTNGSAEALRLIQAKIRDGGFPTIKKGMHFPKEALGITRKLRGSKYIYVRYATLKSIIAPHDIRAVLADWAEQGLILKSGNGKVTRQIKVKGHQRRERYVCIDKARL
jgi:uncharacterized protein (DUF927 family)